MEIGGKSGEGKGDPHPGVGSPVANDYRFTYRLPDFSYQFVRGIVR